MIVGRLESFVVSWTVDDAKRSVNRLSNDTLMTLVNNDLPWMAVEWLLWRLPCEQKPPMLSNIADANFLDAGQLLQFLRCIKCFQLSHDLWHAIGCVARAHQMLQRLTVTPRTPKRQSNTWVFSVATVYTFNITYIYMSYTCACQCVSWYEGKHTYLNIDVFVCKVPQRVWWKQFYEALKTHDMSRTCWQTRTFVS